MVFLIPTIKYGSTYYNTFTMGVSSNYHGYFFQCIFIFRSAIRVYTNFSTTSTPIFINFCQETLTSNKFYFDTQLHVLIFKENIQFSHKK